MLILPKILVRMRLALSAALVTANKFFDYACFVREPILFGCGKPGLYLETLD
jgi:hypothetical protein